MFMELMTPSFPGLGPRSLVDDGLRQVENGNLDLVEKKGREIPLGRLVVSHPLPSANLCPTKGLPLSLPNPWIPLNPYGTLHLSYHWNAPRQGLYCLVLQSLR